METAQDSEILFSIDTEVLQFSFSRPEPETYLIEAEGQASAQEITEIIKALNSELNSKSKVRLIALVKNLDRFPWGSRQYLFDTFSELFLKGVLTHVYLVAPSKFVKMVAFLIGSFYKVIDFSVESDYETALAKSRKKGIKTSTIDLAEIESAIASKTSSENVIFREVIEDRNFDSSNAQMISYFIEPNIYLFGLRENSV